MGFDLADMQSLSKCNREIRYLLSAIDFFRKYAWVVPLKDKRGITIVNTFQNILGIQTENQIKFGLIKAVDFTIIC